MEENTNDAQINCTDLPVTTTIGQFLACTWCARYVHMLAETSKLNDEIIVRIKTHK
jgi:hypothetical protein